MEEFEVLTLDEQLSVTNDWFIDYLLQKENNGRLGRLAKYKAMRNWITDISREVIEEIIQKEIWFRKLVYEQHLLVDIIGLIGCGKTTLGQMIAQSAGGCVVPAFDVYVDGGEKTKFSLDKVGELVPHTRIAGFFGELPDVEDVLPNAVNMTKLDELNKAKAKNWKTLQELYIPKEEKIFNESSLKIQKAYLDCRKKQGVIVGSLRDSGHRLLITRDGSPFSDRFMFTEKFVDDGTLRRVFVDEIVDDLFKKSLQTYKPDFVIMYRGTIDECLEGIWLRKRDIELLKDVGVDREYLEGLERHIKKIPSKLDEYEIPHIDLRRVDFMKSPMEYIGLLDKIGTALIEVIKDKRRKLAG